MTDAAPPRVWAIVRPSLLVLAALYLLLALTVGSAFVPMGAFNSVANWGIAAAKALLVACAFMNLKRDDALLRLTALAAFFWLVVLFALTFSDYLTRPT